MLADGLLPYASRSGHRPTLLCCLVSVRCDMYCYAVLL